MATKKTPYFGTLLCLIAFAFTTSGQTKITFTNGSTKVGDYTLKDMTLGWATPPKIVSRRTNEKYALDEMISLMVSTESDSIRYEVIRVKKYSDSKKGELKLGKVVFKGNKI